MAGPYEPTTVYVTLEGSIVQEISNVVDEPETVVDALYYDTEYWRNLFNAGELGRPIPADKGTSIITGVANGVTPTATAMGTGSTISGGYVASSASGYGYAAQVVFPTNPDTYMAKDDRMQATPTPPRPLAKSRSKIVFPRGQVTPTVATLVPVWFWADEVIGYSTSRPSLLGYS